jgi:hypothetical protein
MRPHMAKMRHVIVGDNAALTLPPASHHSPSRAVKVSNVPTHLLPVSDALDLAMPVFETSVPLGSICVPALGTKLL